MAYLHETGGRKKMCTSERIYYSTFEKPMCNLYIACVTSNAMLLYGFSLFKWLKICILSPWFLDVYVARTVDISFVTVYIMLHCVNN